MTFERIKNEDSEEYAIITSMEDDSGEDSISDESNQTNSSNKESRNIWFIIIAIFCVIFVGLYFLNGKHLITTSLISFGLNFILLSMYLYLVGSKSEDISFILLKASVVAIVFLIIGIVGLIFGIVGLIIGNILAIIVVMKFFGYSFASAFLFLMIFGFVNYAILMFLASLI